MKKLLALIVLLLGLTDTQAQNFTYRPLKEFHGDTIDFLKSNFYDQRSYFAGKIRGSVRTIYARYATQRVLCPWHIAIQRPRQ